MDNGRGIGHGSAFLSLMDVFDVDYIFKILYLNTLRYAPGVISNYTIHFMFRYTLAYGWSSSSLGTSNLRLTRRLKG